MPFLALLRRLLGPATDAPTATDAHEAAPSCPHRRAQLVRRDGRDVSTLYGREGVGATGEGSGSAQGGALPGAGRGRWRRQRRGGGSAGAATRTGRPKRSFMAIAEPMTSARSQAVMAISAPTHRKMDTFGGKCLRHAEARSSRLTSPRRIDSACSRGTG